MSEANKALARELFSRFDGNDIPGVLGLMADDATWEIVGKNATLPAAGTHTKQGIERMFHGMYGRLVDGLRMQVIGLIAEDDQVAVEVESRGELKNGRLYEQRYHFLITCRDGQIATVKEYLDTQHVHAVWFAP
jgi:ketosteroid isomerase-like protein